MQVDKIINVPLKVGDIVEIEHTSVERKKIKATVSCCSIKDGKGVAIFCTENGEVYTWKPNPSPHGEVVRIDRERPDILINPYVTAYCTQVSKYRPVHASTGEYSYTEWVCETHNWGNPLAPHGDRVCLDCYKVVNDKFQ